MNIKTTLKTSVAAAALFAVAVPSVEAGTVSNGNGNSVTLSGQVNKALMYVDDGKSTGSAIVDNDNSGSRFRILGSGKVNEALSVGTALEVEFQDNAGNNFALDDSNSNGAATTANNDAGFGQTNFNQRRMEAYFNHKQFGKLSIGQGPTASDGTAEVSLSGAGMAAGGGFMFNGQAIKIRTANQTENTFTAATFGNKTSNLDGASRSDRIRYDTPTFAGFQVSGSAISDGRADVALRYSGKFGGVAVKAAASYLNSSSASTTDDDQYVISAAAEHDSGLNIRGQYGKADFKSNARDDQSTWSVGLGYDASLTSLGATSFAASYTVDENVAANKEELTFYDFGVVQHISDVGTEVYLGVTFAEFDDSTATSYEDAMWVLAGTRIKF